MSQDDQSGRPSRAHATFVTTHWSVVVRAGGASGAETGAALAELCQAYWYPLYAYIRRLGRTPHDAEDLTQAFFARLLEKNYVAGAQQEKGKFRTFLLTALKRFLANEWDREHAQKRGGMMPVVSIDQALGEARWNSVPQDALSPDLAFERQWATTLLDQVMARLQREYAASQRATLFEHLRPCLVRGGATQSYAAIARQLQLTEPAVKMAVQRLRTRYREILREEIGKTVERPEEVDGEIRHLFTAFDA
jgi:RNA polymerase sigma-70 factor (ECF subfamily)